MRFITRRPDRGVERFFKAAAMLLFGVMAATTGQAGPGPIRAQNVISVEDGAAPSTWLGHSALLPHSRAQLAAIKTAATATVPYWSTTVTSPLDNNTYTVDMVGGSPYAAPPVNTTVTYVPIVLKLTVSGRRTSVTFDPTKPACNDTVAVQSRFFNSPIFQAQSWSSNGVAVGTQQLVSAFQTANFWSATKASTYGVTLSPSTTTPIVVSATVKGTVASVRCANGKTASLGEVDINTFDSLIESIVTKYATPTQLPLVLTYNVVQTESGSCCILGYHNAIAVSAGAQTYSVGSYIDSGVFSGVDDVVVWSHEIAEWVDDPFVQASLTGGGNDDLTPAWGKIGQVSTCQNNLEVGDPLSGTEFAVSGAGGFTYHFQDLAFHDWFYRTASTGTGGRFSFMGTFTAAQPTVCS